LGRAKRDGSEFQIVRAAFCSYFCKPTLPHRGRSASGHEQTFDNVAKIIDGFARRYVQLRRFKLVTFDRRRNLDRIGRFERRSRNRRASAGG
jgi:hypothetical protein